AGFIKAHTLEQHFFTTISERPETRRFARFQVENGSNAVATLTGLNLEIKDPAIGKLLFLTDGTRDIEDLTQAMLEYAANSAAAAMSDKDDMREVIMSNLLAFGVARLLVGKIRKRRLSARGSDR